MRALVIAVSLIASQILAPTHAGESKVANGQRTNEDFQLVIERHRGELYAEYLHALNDAPGLKGKIVLSISIDAGGKMTQCDVVSSTLGHAGLRAAIVSRLRAIDFGAKGTNAYHYPNFQLWFVPELPRKRTN